MEIDILYWTLSILDITGSLHTINFFDQSSCIEYIREATNPDAVMRCLPVTGA